MTTELLRLAELCEQESGPDRETADPSPKKRRHKRKMAWYLRTIASLRERDGDDCWICKCPTTRSDRTLDHLMPVSRGGSDELDNLRLAHGDCNRRRGNALPKNGSSMTTLRARSQDSNHG